MTISKSIQAACGMTISKDKVTSSIKYGHCMSLSNSLFVCFKFAIFTHRVDVQKKHSIPRHLPCILNFNQLQRKKDMSYLLDPPESNLTMVFFSTKWGFPWFSMVFQGFPIESSRECSKAMFNYRLRCPQGSCPGASLPPC